MAVIKFGANDVARLLDALDCKRAVLVRRVRAESNSEIRKLIDADIAALDALKSAVSTGQVSID